MSEQSEHFWAVVTKEGRAACWLAEHAVLHAALPDLVAAVSEFPCDGPIQACHLIPKQELKRTELLVALEREFKRGTGTRADYELARDRIVYDPKLGKPGCERHHKMLDFPGVTKIVVPRKWLPPGVEQMGEQLGLDAWLDKRYGDRLGI